QQGHPTARGFPTSQVEVPQRGGPVPVVSDSGQQHQQSEQLLIQHQMSQESRPTQRLSQQHPAVQNQQGHPTARKLPTSQVEVPQRGGPVPVVSDSGQQHQHSEQLLIQHQMSQESRPTQRLSPPQPAAQIQQGHPTARKLPTSQVEVPQRGCPV